MEGRESNNKFLKISKILEVTLCSLTGNSRILLAVNSRIEKYLYLREHNRRIFIVSILNKVHKHALLLVFLLILLNINLLMENFSAQVRKQVLACCNFYLELLQISLLRDDCCKELAYLPKQDEQ